MEAVRVEGLSKDYADVRALRELQFTINKGELFGFIGPDGAGKTSLFRILCTLLLADEGKAELMGLDVVKDYKAIRKIVGYMPGKFSLYQDLTVEENLNFFATVFGTTIEANYEMIREIYQQIEPFRNRLAGQLSGGMKQKLALSCALIHKPEILFLDEPTTGVDAVSRKEFWEMLAKLRDDGLTILVSTPYMDEASRCSRVALMQGGRILNIDTPEGIIDQYPWKLFGIKADDMYALLQCAASMKEVISAYRFGQDIHLAVKPGKFSIETIREMFITKGFDSIKVEDTRAGIEDCFMDLMVKQTTDKLMFV